MSACRYPQGANPVHTQTPQIFMQSLRLQRWDDHRYYRHCRINQSLHLVSALSFIAAYILLFISARAVKAKVSFMRCNFKSDAAVVCICLDEVMT